MSVIDLQPSNAERSISDGGIWAVSSAAAILHLSEDGTTLDYLTQLDLDTGETNLIDPVGVVDPDGRAGWFTERDATDTLYRVDFVAERDPGAPFRLPAVPLPSSLGFVPIGASNPTAATPYAWLWDPGPPARYATIDTLGTFVVHLTEEADESDSRAVVSHRSGDLCVFSEVDATSTVRHRRISALGAVSLPSAVVASSGVLRLRSPFSFPEPDVCGVVAGTDDTHVLVWDDAPLLVASHVDADPLESVTVAADGIYWGAGPLTAQPGARFLVRLVQGTSGAFVRETFPIDVPNTPLFLP